MNTNKPSLNVGRNTLLLNSHYFHKVLSCPLCNSNQIDYIGSVNKHLNINDQLIKVDIDNYGLMQCSFCSLVFRNYTTKPKTEEMLQGSWFDQGKKFNRWQATNISGYYRIKKFVDSYFKTHFPDQIGKLLDIGVGEGDFVSIFTKDYMTYGLEKYPIKGIDYKSVVNSKIIIDDLETINGIKSNEKFKVITVFDTFEHLKTPKTAIKNIFDILDNSGLLFLETGNIDCLIPRVLGRNKWWYVKILEHKIFWSINTLTNALKKEGFIILQVVPKAHKAGLFSTYKNFIKFIGYKICPQLYRTVLKIMNKNYKNKPRLRVPWADHFLLIAQKP